MSQAERIHACCVVKCPNAASNSKVSHYSFPRFRRKQRNQWVQAIKSHNGKSWTPNAHSLVCCKHFVKGKPKRDRLDVDHVPSIFPIKKRKQVIKSRAVTMKKFALEYIKHDALLEKPTSSNMNNEKRRRAYVTLAYTLDIPVSTCRAWERRFRQYFEEKTAQPSADKWKLPAAGPPHWLTVVEKRLYANPLHRLSAGAVSPGGVVAALCSAAQARGSLCSTALYNDVRRALRLSSAITELHAVWVSAQRVSLAQVAAAGRGGDACPPPAAAAAVADLLLLHTDVNMHRLVTDESVTLYEEAAALHTLWQLVQRHRLQDAAPPRVRAQRWSRAHADYLASGRSASLVVLQRRWHELKLQARERLAAHWRRPRASALDPAPDPAPHVPRPAPLHIAILKRYPHIATDAFPRWRRLVLDGSVVTAPLEEETDAKEVQGDDNEPSPETGDRSDDAAVEQLYPNLSRDDKPTVEQEVLEQSDVEEAQGGDNEHAPETSDRGDDAVVEQLYPNLSRVDEPIIKQTTDNDPAVVVLKVEQTADSNLLYQQNMVDDPLAKETKDSSLLVKQNILNDPLAEETKDCDLLVKQNMVNDPLAEETKDCDLLVKQNMINEPCAEETKAIDLLVKQNTASDPLTEETKDSDLLVNQNSVSNPLTEETKYSDLLVKQNMVNDPLTEKTKDIDLLVKQNMVSDPLTEETKDSGLMFKQNMVNVLLAKETTDSDLLVKQNMVNDLLVKQHMVNDLLVVQSTVADLLSESVASGTASAVVWNTPSKPARRVKDEVVTQKRAHLSDTDTDLEDNLVIDERSYSASRSLKQESVAHTETHSVKTVSPPAPLGNVAPTIEMLHMIDPSTVKTEIVFESDEDDFQPCNEDFQVEIELKRETEASFISNRILFADEEPAERRDVTSPDDVTEHMRGNSERDGDDLVDDTPQIDPKLLMDTNVELFRIDECRAWKKYARKDNSIRVSRIKKSVVPHTSKCSNTKTQEIKVDKATLDEVARTHSIRQLCSDIKRELMEEQLALLEGTTPSKQAAPGWESDDDEPLLVVREASPREGKGRRRRRTAERKPTRESSSDDERLSKRRDEKMKHGAHHAASTVEWSAAFEPAYGQAARRVRLPDMEQVRRRQRAAAVAQVAPISAVDAGVEDELSTQAQPGDEDDTTAAWSALDLPPEHQLQAALDELSTLSSAQQMLERAHCCVARRHRAVNDARRRIGLPEVSLHSHPEGECTCCCAFSSAADERLRLDQEMRALHADIERMLRTMENKKQKQKASRPHHSDQTSVQKLSRPPARAPAQPTAPQTANTATEAKGSEAKPAANTNRSRSKRSRARAPSPPASPPPAPLDDYEEWQRQKNVNMQYFYINNLTSCSEKKKRCTAPATAPAQSVAAPDIPAAPTPPAPPARVLASQQAPPQVFAAQTITPVRVFAAQPASSALVLASQPNPPATPTHTPVPPAPARSRRASSQTQHSTKQQVEQKTTTNDAFPKFGSIFARRMRSSNKEVIETVSVQAALDSEPKGKCLSILEEYSRTFSAPPVPASVPVSVPVPVPMPLPATPAVNTVHVQVTAPQGPQTTIVMALTLPADNNNSSSLYANSTFDLTTEVEPRRGPSGATQHANAPVLRFIRVPKMYRSSKRVSKTREDHKRPKLMSLCTSLRDGDVIEITDSDSNQSDGSRSSDSNDTRVPIGPSSNTATNNSANEVKCSNQTTDITASHENSQQAANNASDGSADASQAKSQQIPSDNKDESGNQATSNNRYAKPNQHSTKHTVEQKKVTIDALPKLRAIAPRRMTSADKQVPQTVSVQAAPDSEPRDKLTSSSAEAVESHLAQRECSRIPELMSLTDDSARCAASRPDLAAMPAFMRALRAAAALSWDELHCYKRSAALLRVSDLSCGGTLLCVEASRPPLTLPGHERPRPRDQPPDVRDHLVLTDATLPCSLPTYWTLAAYGATARVVPDDTPGVSVSDAGLCGSDAGQGGAGEGSSATDGQVPVDDRKVCQKSHNFKVLTAFCSAEGVRQAARAGAALLLLHVRRARVLVLRVRRRVQGVRVRHHAQADVECDLLREIERMLDKAEAEAAERQDVL